MKGIALLPALGLLPLLAAPASGQALAARVAAAPDGEVRISYSARPGSCSWEPAEDAPAGARGGTCSGEQVRVALAVRGGRVEGVRTTVGGVWGRGGGHATDLGRVGAREAAEYLVDLAEAPGDGRVGSAAVFAAVLADSARVEPALARIARSAEAPARTRRTARFWLAQAAADASAPREVGEAENGRTAAQNDSVFALVKLPRGQRIPELVRVAREHSDPGVRRLALFWLGASGDPRAVDLFEELLAGR
jgi:HEAT repeat protein